MDRRLLAALLLACLIATSLPGCHGAKVDATADSGIQTGHSASTDTAGTRGFREKSEKFNFQAEVSRLMDIIINSLYSNKDIFLRELISNASDALDKIRFLALTDKSVLGDGENANLEIRISIDKDNRILRIRDRGVGMTKADLINNLGTIAKSGTSAFLEQMQKGGDLNLIGQFGVGFYSVYLVADYVEVISKHNDDKQWIWESKADGSFAVSEDTEGEPLGRGTQINLHLKEETQEYADEAKLKELVAKYSEFINFPIYLYSSKEVEVEVPADEDSDDTADTDDDAEEAADAEDTADDKEEGVEDEDEEADDEEDDDKKPKTVKETRWDWELLNDNKAIWLRNPGDVPEEDYDKFYKAISKKDEKPLTYAHFKAEGDVEFKALLYVPKTPDYDFWDNYYTKKHGLKLYVRRVFISDEFEDLIPKYLSFMKGLVDSDTLPLSVSRETLQQHSSLKVIKKKVVRKALDIIRKLADAEATMKEAQKEAKEGEEVEASILEEGQKYGTFWKEYAKAIKLGLIEDSGNRGRLAKLLRFHTSQSPDKLTSLDEYISRMKEDQTHIYFLSGQSIAELQKSPLVERLLAQGLEVIFFTDPVDEYVTQHLQEYEDKKLQNASKDDLKLGGEKGKKDKAKQKALKAEFKDMLKWWTDVLGSGAVEGVKLSSRLATTPCVVVTSKHGWSANMERIMRAQALGDAEKQSYMKGKKTLEINPRHPLVRELKAKYEDDAEAEGTKALAHLLFDTALLESGYSIDDPKSFNSRVYSLMQKSLGLEGELTVPEEDDSPEVPDEEETASSAKAGDDATVSADDDVKDEL